VTTTLDPMFTLPATLKRIGVVRSVECARARFSGDTLASVMRGIVARAAVKCECSEQQVRMALGGTSDAPRA
jgi:hypothetical protein